MVNATEEQEQIQAIAKLTLELLNKRYGDTGKFLRGVHPKSHGCVKAVFKVSDSIDDCLQVGLFAKPGASYEATVRCSNADTLVRHDLRDGKNGSRGMAIKIHDVAGDVLHDDNGKSSQDFLMINTQEFAFANVPDYLRLQQILLEFDDEPGAFFAPLKEAMPTDPEKIAEVLRIKQSFAVVSKIQSIVVGNPLEVAYFGAAPFAFGSDHVMRFSVAPRGPEKPQEIPSDRSENYLREAFQKTISGSEDVVFDFRIQVRGIGEADLHLEDATQSWSLVDFPPVTVASITIPVPQSGEADCEGLLFTPWHALCDHEPLGSINRLRKAVYFASADQRRGKPKVPDCAK